MTKLLRVFCLLLLPAGLIYSDSHPITGLDESLSITEEQRDIDLFKKAEELFSATLYKEAIPLYIEIRSDSLKSSARSRLGLALFYDGQYARALASFKEISEDSLTEKSKRDNRLFTALCYRSLGQYDDVVAVLSNGSVVDLSDDCLFELGLAHFFLDHRKEASHCFSQVKVSTTKPSLNFLSHFYLARLALKDGNYQEAMSLLDALPCTSEEALKRELFFLKGESAFYNKDYPSAIDFFQQALLAAGAKSSWYRDTLYNLGWAYLKHAEDENVSVNDKKIYLNNASEIFKQLVSSNPNEYEVIALANSYLLQATLLNNTEAYIQAEWALSGVSYESSEEGRFYAQLIRAEASDSYERRESAYQQLLDSFYNNSVYVAKIWYMKAVNNFDEAQKLRSAEHFVRAGLYFEKAYNLSDIKTGQLAQNCLKFQAQSLWEQGTMNNRIEALNVLEAGIKSCPESRELDDLYGAYAVHLIEENVSQRILQRVEQTLKERSSLEQAHTSMLALAAFYFKSGQYNDAYEQYLSFIKRYAESPLVPQVKLQATLALEHLSTNRETIREMRRKIYEEYPESEWAPLAYFISYSYQDYLQGTRRAVKHLEGFKDKFPDSPLLINIYYLLGLDLKRDRKSPEGKWVQKKSSTKSLEAFAEAEAAFDRLFKGGKIPDDELRYYINIRYRAALERGLVHYDVAKASSAAKRDIYLQYAIDSFEALRKELETPNHALASLLTTEKQFSSIHEECLYWLALTYLQSGNKIAAQNAFDNMLRRYEEASISGGYYLSRIYYEQGVAASNSNRDLEALRFFVKADEASKGKYLSVDEKLDLWLCQSECYKALGQNENAMLALSKVINDDSISHLRVKAMFMRALLYEKMGRPELARRQLEFVAKMNGDWSERAKIKLDKDYATP